MAACFSNDLVSHSLPSIFEKGLEIHSSLDECAERSSSQKYQEDVKKAIEIFEDATRKVSTMSLFSENEDIDEIATSDLKYLLLPAFLGSLTLKLQTESRYEILHLAEIYFKDFLTRLKNYKVTSFEILSEPDQISKENSHTCENAKLSGLLQMTRQREEKIRRYKEMKEIELQLVELKKIVDKNSNVDEEVKRDYYLTFIRKWTNQAIDELAAIKMEKPLANKTLQSKESVTNSDASNLERLKPKPLKPIIITKNDLQKKVYGLGYPSMPTMTVDEFYEQKVKEGTFTIPDMSLQAAALGNFDRMAQKEEDEIQHEKETETDDIDALKRTREWDDWKDDHRRGWGNRQNMG